MFVLPLGIGGLTTVGVPIITNDTSMECLVEEGGGAGWGVSVMDALCLTTLSPRWEGKLKC